MQVKKVQLRTDFLYQNPYHKENFLNVYPLWGKIALGKSLA
jgi:hypothetical protein